LYEVWVPFSVELGFSDCDCAVELRVELGDVVDSVGLIGLLVITSVSSEHRAVVRVSRDRLDTIIG
jgi:hypothetical protein